MTPRAAPSERTGAVGAEGILDAALEVFHHVGYGGASVRQIAKAADVTVAALYYHFPSKHDILHTLMQRAMETIIRETEAALADVGDGDPVERFSAAVRAHIRYHTVHQVEAFVGNSELRSLEGDGKRDVIALRDHHEQLFTQLIQAGIDSGDFDVDSAKHAARAVLAMCTSVASWFRLGGASQPEEVADRYVRYSLNTVACRR